MELLERDGALAALAEARDAAARGEGRVVFVTGEPGIGKTSLVTRFVRDLEAGARVLFGTCDDLSIPRPLGPIRDLVGSVSAPLEEALAAGAAPHDIQSLLIAELELPPRPTVLVLEDVHWADDATLDSITVLGRRIGSLPALLVLTFRGGEVPPGHPLHAAVGAIRADDSVCPRARAALRERGRLARRRRRGRGLRGDRQATRSTSPSCSPRDRPPSCRRRSRTRCSDARRGSTTPRGASSSSSRSCRAASRTSLLDAVMPGWPAAAEEPERRQLLEVDPRYVRFRHELARNAIRSSVPIAARRRLHAEILEALLAADADPADIVHHAEAAGAEDVVADYALVAARRAAALESNREAYSHYRRASDFVDRLPPAEQAAVLEELATAAYVVGRLDDAFPAIERAIAIYRELGDQRGRRPLHAGPVAVPLVRGRRRAGAGEGARGDRDPRAARRVGRARPRLQRALAARDARAGHRAGVRVGRAGARARDPARRRAHARARARQHRHRQVQLDSGETADAPRGARRRRRRRRPRTRRRARSRTSATRSCAGCGRSRRCRYARAGARLRPGARGAQPRSYIATTLAWLRLRAGEWDEAERVARGEIETGHHRHPAAREDGAGRAGRPPRRSGRRRAARRPRGPGRPHRRAAADRAGARAARPSGR